MTSRSLSVSKRLRYIKYKIIFGEREDDIYINTFHKSGTTWMQMILYQMTTDGKMDFDHIYNVSPWLHNLAFAGKELRDDYPTPRVIKSHDPYKLYDRYTKGRFIVVIRDGYDVINSLLHHCRSYEKSDMTLEEVLEKYFDEKSDFNYYTFMEGWLRNKHKFPILYVRYEDLKTDFDNQIKRISNFLEIELTEEKMARVKARSSFEFMKEHEEKFGEQPTKKDKRVFDQFIRKGEVGEGKDILSNEQKQAFQSGFDRHIKKHLKTVALNQARYKVD